MDRSTPIKLLSPTYSTDALLQVVTSYTERTVYVNLQSTGRREWQAAHELGLNPEYEATMFGPDYNGELVAEINNTRYAVYRTYQGRNDELTLYLERQVGHVKSSS